MRIAVTGGRAFTGRALVFGVLDTLHWAKTITALLHGDATGLDALAKTWAGDRRVTQIPFPADWSVGSSAGPTRNRRMIGEGQPELLVAFPGGNGTRHCVSVAVKYNVPVLYIGDT